MWGEKRHEALNTALDHDGADEVVRLNDEVVRQNNE